MRQLLIKILICLVLVFPTISWGAFELHGPANNNVEITGGTMSGVDMTGQSMGGMSGGEVTGDSTFTGDVTVTGTSTFNGSATVVTDALADPSLRIEEYIDSVTSRANIDLIVSGGTPTAQTNVSPTYFGHLSTIATRMYFNNAERLANNFVSYVSPFWDYTNPTHANKPEAAYHIGFQKDGIYHHAVLIDPTFGTLFAGIDDTLHDRYSDARLTVSGDVEIYDGASLGGEILQNNTDFSQATWTVDTAGFNKSGSVARFLWTGGTTTGIVGQSSANFLLGAPSRGRYIISVNIENMSCGTNNVNLNYLRIESGGAGFVKSGHGDANTKYGNNGEILAVQDISSWVTYNNGTVQRAFQGAENAIIRFRIEASASGTCTFDITAVSAKRVIGGDLRMSGQLINEGGIKAIGTAPALDATCGSDATIKGTDLAGIITAGTAGNGLDATCGITFNIAFDNAPACTLTSNADVLLATTSTTKIDPITDSAGAAVNDSSKIMYICIGL